MKTVSNQVIEIPVELGQRLSDIIALYPLPTNGIFHKILPGLGATYGEINALRHSIIVLPNVPVIKDKVKKYNQDNDEDKRILGVFKGVTKEQIMSYMSDESITYKKILTTPEGYRDKVREALKGVFDYVKKEFYLLIDECERTIQDVDFREKIVAPFDDLFSFNNKGLISATTLPFSDPRLEKEFTHYIIKPSFDYTKPLKLTLTNNVVAATREYFTETNGNVYYIFLSSIKTITALIENLGIRAESKVHCSESRMTELKLKHFKVDSNFNKDDVAKYNFFTSRFYSAFDIELDYKPDVLLLTEVVFAEHSILDPKTEVIQIAGRFRGGFNSLTHITNTDTKIDYKTSEEVRIYMNGQQDVYKQILSLKEKMPSLGSQEAISQILTEPTFARYFNRDGSYNWFMLDNFIQEERVLGLYQCTGNLKAAYKQVENHFSVTINHKNYPLTDADRLKLDTIDSRKELYKEIVRQIKHLTPRHDSYVLGGEEMLHDVQRINPLLFEAYHLIGEKGIIESEYSEARIKIAVESAKKNKALFSTPVINDINRTFKKGKVYLETYITSALQKIYDKYNISLRARPGQICNYFKAYRSTQKGEKVYVIEDTIKFDRVGKVIDQKDKPQSRK